LSAKLKNKLPPGQDCSGDYSIKKGEMTNGMVTC
jgi:hypothetical protein